MSRIGEKLRQELRQIKTEKGLVDLCDYCARPRWHKICAYCRGYYDGVIDTLNDNVDKKLMRVKLPSPSPEQGKED